jgi:hypothetical protein
MVVQDLKVWGDVKAGDGGATDEMGSASASLPSPPLPSGASVAKSDLPTVGAARSLFEFYRVKYPGKISKP